MPGLGRLLDLQPPGAARPSVGRPTPAPLLRSPVDEDVVERAALDVEEVGVARPRWGRGRAVRRTRKRQFIGQQPQEERRGVGPAHAQQGALA